MALLSNIAIFGAFSMMSEILWLHGDKWSGGLPNNINNMLMIYI